MLSPKHLPRNKPSFDDHIKLPKIPSRKNIHSIKKNAPTPDLPNIKNHSKPNLSINKENKSLNLLQRKNSLDQEIKARLNEVEAAQKIVKNILGAPETTMNLGGDITNFELKIEINREILRKQRTNVHSTQKNSILPPKQCKSQKELSIKCVSSKEIPSESVQMIPVQGDIKLKMNENCEVDAAAKKDEENEPDSLNRKQFNSERKPKKAAKQKTQENTKVFKSIKQILENPQKIALENDARKAKKLVKFTIEELENRLRQMKNFDLSQSAIEGLQETEKSKKMDKKMATVKSTGMIPLMDGPIISEDYTLKNWNKIEFGQRLQSAVEDNVNSGKQIKHHKSDFDQEVDQIQKLEMKSYKSIEKMVENRKLLIDLQLMSLKNKSCMASDKKLEAKVSEANH